MTRPFDRMRSAIANLSRPDLRALAHRVGANRDTLFDFADINIALDPACMAKLENWFADFALRAMLSDPARMKQMCDLPAAIGIDRAAYEAFLSDEGDLPQAQRLIFGRTSPMAARPPSVARPSLRLQLAPSSRPKCAAAPISCMRCAICRWLSWSDSPPWPARPPDRLNQQG
ncbi:hypothetical protein QO058_01575 [Bosea vestrisii]|uniref:hypothetical protein n=1 Tax=Bosea vestrisii TaxID=151416 RepID=UPI0024DFBD87|nr:hypothetical protein [Bosea vestrisii]WID97002.1 hypothetical protein QO058_01575 [Bosea vestrisii]